MAAVHSAARIQQRLIAALLIWLVTLPRISLQPASVAMLGLIPMLFATGPGSEVTRPLAVVVISGLVTSTLLTLVVVPALFKWFDEKPIEA